MQHNYQIWTYSTDLNLVSVLKMSPSSPNKPLQEFLDNILQQNVCIWIYYLNKDTAKNYSQENTVITKEKDNKKEIK